MLTLPQIFVRFRMAIFLYWAMSAAILGYWVVYLEGEKKIATTEIGVLMSLYVCAALTGQYVFGFLSDKLQSIRLPVSAAAMLFAAAVATIPLQTSKSWLYPSMALLGFLQQPIGPMLDSWTLKHLNRYDQKTLFGKIRSFGSLGWATTALLTAYMILYISWNMMFVVAVVAGLLLSLMALTIPDVAESFVETPGEESRLTIGRALSHLFGNSAYLYILAVVFLMYLGVQTTFNFQGLLIKGTGGGVQELGWTFFFGVMSEMPAMFLSVWLLPRMSARKLMIIAGGLYMLRYALIIYFQTSWIIMVTACLEGVAFGLLLTALRSYVFAVVAEDVQTSAMTVVDATFLGLTVIIGGLVGGWLIERYSPMHMVTACAVCSGLAMLLLLAGRRFDHQGTQAVPRP
jgi:PPP family 3-phenylpropionic acid transporter